MKFMLTPKYSFFFLFSRFLSQVETFDHLGVKKGQLLSVSPAVGVKCAHQSVLGLSQPLAQFFMIKGRRGGKKPVGQPHGLTHSAAAHGRIN